MAAKKQPEIRTLDLQPQQVEKLNALAFNITTGQKALRLYASAVLDANGLDGVWTLGEIQGDPPRMEVVKQG